MVQRYARPAAEPRLLRAERGVPAGRRLGRADKAAGRAVARSRAADNPGGGGNGGAVLGLALSPEAAPRLEAPKNEGWSERLKARMKLTSAADVAGEVEELLRRAWELS